ncbi:hypothetical protein AAK967_01775 [Atopobiaceae bacterium 24-176]
MAAVVALGYFVGKPAFERWRAVEDARAALTGTWYSSDSWSEFTRETRIDFNGDGSMTMSSGARVFQGSWEIVYEEGDGACLVYSSDELGYTGSDFSLPMPGGHGTLRVESFGVDTVTLVDERGSYTYYSTEGAAQEAMVSELTGSDMETLSDAPSFGGEGATMGETTQKPSLDLAQEDLGDIGNLRGTWYISQNGQLSSIDLDSEGYAALEDYGAFWARQFQMDGRVYGSCSWSYDSADHMLTLSAFFVRNTTPDGHDYSLGGSLNQDMIERFEVLSIDDTRVGSYPTEVMELQASDGSVIAMYSDANAAAVGEGE